jgi:[ribosomal protein S18]-alanine N-acetyltransferase
VEVAVATVRQMTEADISAVAALEARAFSEPWSPVTFAEELAITNRSYVVAEDGGVIVGYGGVMCLDREAHIMTIAVDTGHTQRKIGTRLMLALIDAALARGAQHLTLEVRVSNEPALGLYRKLGFASVGLRPNYYRDEDALVMWAVNADDDPFRRRLDRVREEVG